MSWYTVEAGRNNTIYVRVNGDSYAPPLCTLPEGNYSTATLATAVCKAMNDKYTIAGPPLNRLASSVSIFNNSVFINNVVDSFEILTDKHVLQLMNKQNYAYTNPLRSVGDMLHNTVEKVVHRCEQF